MLAVGTGGDRHERAAGVFDEAAAVGFRALHDPQPRLARGDDRRVSHCRGGERVPEVEAGLDHVRVRRPQLVHEVRRTGRMVGLEGREQLRRERDAVRRVERHQREVDTGLEHEADGRGIGAGVPFRRRPPDAVVCTLPGTPTAPSIETSRTFSGSAGSSSSATAMFVSGPSVRIVSVRPAAASAAASSTSTSGASRESGAYLGDTSASPLPASAPARHSVRERLRIAHR